MALHARTAAQLYDGEARWEKIAELKRAVTRIPVLGNGDVWEAEDALRMTRATGCDGVVVGRGCLGRPWLFRDLADVFDGRAPQDPPALGGVVDVMIEHARLLVAWLGHEAAAMRAFRKHSSWYTKCFPDSAPLRQRLMQVLSLGELRRAAVGARPLAALSARGDARAAREDERHAEGGAARGLPRPPRRRHRPGAGGRDGRLGRPAVPHPLHQLREGRLLPVHQDAHAVDAGREPEHGRDRRHEQDDREQRSARAAASAPGSSGT